MERTFVILNTGVYGIYAPGTNIFTEENCIITVKQPEKSFRIVDEKDVPVKARKLLKEILKCKKERIYRQEKQNSVKAEIEKLEKTITELRGTIAVLEQERETYQKEINTLVKAYAEEKKLRDMKKLVKGNEVLKMSFYNGTLDRVKAKAILLKAKRPITFTYGLGYRNPTTYHAPKTLEEALEIIGTESLLDIDFTEKEIHLNAYSANDMW